MTDGRSTIIIELSQQISEQENTIATMGEQLLEKDAIIKKLKAKNLSPREVKSIIEQEADEANKELQSLAKEIKQLKRKKKRIKAVPPSEEALSRELSSLSRDSGADLTSPAGYGRITTYSVLTPTESLTSYESCSTVVM